MKTIEGICKELKALDGVVGAFVLRQSQCVGSSLPLQYDPGRLAQVGATLARVSQMSQKAGYDGCSTAFHWQRASLLTWPLGEDGLLGLLAAPNAVREAVELSATVALEDLTDILASKPAASPRDERAANVAPAAPVPEPDAAKFSERLGEIERLLVQELGPGGKALLERCRTRTPRGSLSATDWLMSLRNTLLSDVGDPGARVTIATSYLWAEFD
jgi:hypothetical protein